MVANRKSPSTANVPEQEDRWSDILHEVHDASKTGRRWYQEIGLFVAWSFGIGASVALVTFILLLIVNLFTSERLLSGHTPSNWLFWASALLLFSGLLAPSASEMADSTQKRNERKKKTNFAVTRRTLNATQTSNSSAEDQRSSTERRSEAVRKRLMRVYNPWRWRLWASALVCFGFSGLAGLVF